MRASAPLSSSRPCLSSSHRFGSPDLKAERSTGLDIGVEQAFFHDRVVADVTYYHNRFSNLIDYDFIANKLQNVGAARTQGVELSASYRPTDRISLSAKLHLHRHAGS